MSWICSCYQLKLHYFYLMHIHTAVSLSVICLMWISSSCFHKPYRTGRGSEWVCKLLMI
jgi:hypothetical protein